MSEPDSASFKDLYARVQAQIAELDRGKQRRAIPLLQRNRHVYKISPHKGPAGYALNTRQSSAPSKSLPR